MVVARRHIFAASSGRKLDANLFRELSAAKGLNVTGVAQAIGVNRNSVGRWLKGTSQPLVDDGIALAELLETSVEKLWPAPRKANR